MCNPLSVTRVTFSQMMPLWNMALTVEEERRSMSNAFTVAGVRINYSVLSHIRAGTSHVAVGCPLSVEQD